MSNTTPEVITFYTKNRQYIWSTIAFVVGLFGGNIDRIPSVIPDWESSERLESLEQRVDAHGEAISKIHADLHSINEYLSDTITKMKDGNN